jgi:hypothetical protein
MKWYNSFQWKPMHGTTVFVWDSESQKQILLKALWNEDDWMPSFRFPIWAYTDETNNPIVIYQPERASEKTSAKEGS